MHMTGKQRILATFNHEPTDHVPWVPFAGVHAAQLKGTTCLELTDPGRRVVAQLEQAEKNVVKIQSEAPAVVLPSGQPTTGSDPEDEEE